MGNEQLVGELIAGAVMALWVIAILLTLIARGRAYARRFAAWLRSTWHGY